VDDTRSLTNVDATVQLIMLQFSFSNINVVPECVRDLPRESINESLSRKRIANGELVINPIENVDVVTFLTDLTSSGYELVDASYQHRVDRRDLRRTYHMVRFVFARSEHATLSNEFLAIRKNIVASLREMCEQAIWRVRLFLNPLFSNDEEVMGEHAVSINLERRTPFCDNVGKPVKVWQKDDNGERIGDAPVQIRPDYYLNFLDRTIQVLPSK